MKRSVLIAAILTAAMCAEGCRSQPEFQHLFDSATAALWRGRMAEARQLIDDGIRRVDSKSESTWYWKFRLLRAEVLLVDGDPKLAEDLVSSPISDRAEFSWAKAKQKYLEGQLEIAQGRPADALVPIEEAIRIAEAHDALDVALAAQALLGQALLRLGRWQEAEATLKGLIDRARSANDKYHEAVALVNLGQGRLIRNRYDEALSFFEPIISFTELAPQLVYARALINAGICFARLGEFERARAALERVIRSHEKDGSELYLQQALGELGNAYVLEGDPRAIPYLQRALDVARRAGAETNAALWANSLATAYILFEQWERADAANRQARILTPDNRQRPYHLLNEAKIAAGRGAWADAAAYYREAAAAGRNDPMLQWEVQAGYGRLEVARQRPERAVQYFDAALDIIERTRAELLKTDHKLSLLSPRLHFYGDYLQVLIDNGQEERALTIADSSRARVLAERHGIEAPERLSPPKLRRTAAHLNGVLLFYWLGSQHSYAWLVTRDRVRFVPLMATNGDIAALVRSYQHLIVASLGDPLASKESPGEQLYEKLIAPMAKWIPHGSRVVVVPDGALNMLNFETLPVPGERRHYWIEDVEVAVAPSLATLTAAVPARESREPAVLLIGDPVSNDPQYPKLRYASAEMEAVSKAFPGRASLYRGDRATPASYREARPGAFDIVHFAAHAAANTESPLDSAVILSRDGSGYKLYARDVANQQLSADLVTISACRSAGDRAYAGEGLVGFAWAFLRAGAKRVIAGLWDVDDRSTADLMGGLYAHLGSGETPAAALRAAKLAMIRGGGVTAKPYYWGPFQVFVGSAVIP